MVIILVENPILKCMSWSSQFNGYSLILVGKKMEVKTGEIDSYIYQGFKISSEQVITWRKLCEHAKTCSECYTIKC